MQRQRREEQAQGAAEGRDDHAFRDELQDDIHAVCAEGESCRDFLAARGEPCEQKIRDVRARDEQHAADRAEEHQVTLALLADGVFQERHHLDHRRRVRIGRVGRFISARDDVHRFARALNRHAGPQPRERLEIEPAAVQLRRNEKRHFCRPRHPKLDLVQRKRFRGFRQHADDRVRPAVERDRLADRGFLSVEMASPEAWAQEHDGLAARSILVSGEVSAHLGFEPKDRQHRGRRVESEHLFRVAASGQGERAERAEREVAEHVLPFLDFEKAGIRKRRSRQVLLGKRRTQPDQALGLLIGQRSQENRIDDAEERDVSADSQREPQHGGGRKAGRLEQLPHGVADSEGHSAY